MAGAKIALTGVAGELQQDSAGNAKVNLPKVKNDAGYVAIIAENHDGLTGGAVQRRNIRASIANRLKIGRDQNVWDYIFNGTLLNTRKYLTTATTMTATVTGGFMNLNAGNSVATTVGVVVRTYKTFPIVNEAQTNIDFSFAMPFVPVSGNEITIGAGIPNTGITAPLDGLYMQIDGAGALQLVANNNGSITTSGTLDFTWIPNKVYGARIVVHRDTLELWIDGVFLGKIERTSGPTTLGSLSMVNTLPLFAQIRNTAGTASAQQLRVANLGVQLGDIDGNRDQSWILSARGDTSLSVPDNVAVAQLQNYVNSTGPVSATLSNTAAGYTTLGGQFQFAAVAGAETDYALFAYQVPALSVGGTGKSFVIEGIEIEAFNMGAASATSATLLQWSLGVGATAVSLATADASTTRAAHRHALGSMSLPVTSPIGARFDNKASKDFSSMPIHVEPGTFIHIIVRIPVGAATASEIIRGIVSVTGLFE